jgi:DNA-binding CsgD family transcriptional regulator
MVLHTAFGDPDSRSDFLVCFSLDQQIKHFLLARRRLPMSRVRRHLTEGTVAGRHFSRTIRSPEASKSSRGGLRPWFDGYRHDPSAFALKRSARLTEASGEHRQICRVDALTTKQVAIIDLIAAGRTDKEIAYRVGMSYRTVRTHLERLYELNGVHCRAALVAVITKRRQLSNHRQNPEQSRG